jgi:hypothetical protein
MLLPACAPVERVEPEPTRAYPVELAPSVMPGLPEVLVPYQDDWPAYWKGTVRGTRALAEARVSVWLVELLGPPISRSPYCVAEGATWEYEVIEGGVVDRGSAPTAAAHRLEVGDDCMATQDARYFSVEPSLIDAFPDLLDSSARVLACVEATAPGCPALGSRLDILSPLAGQDPFEPLSVNALRRDAARVLYARSCARSHGRVQSGFQANGRRLVAVGC